MHSQETKDRLRAAQRADWTPERRQRHGQHTRQCMARPGISEKVSDATKRGTARWRETKLHALRDAWRAADKSVRAAFLADHFARLAQSVAAKPGSDADE